MASPLALVWDLIAHDNASAAFGRVSTAAKGAAKETGGAGAALTKMGGVVALAGVAVAAISVKMATDFQTSTTLLVTGAGESEKGLEKVKQGILDMAGSVGVMPIELSKGMYMIESAGYHGAAGLQVLKAAAEGAKIGGADMRTVADGLTTAMKDYNIPTAQAAVTTSKLVAAVGAGKTTMFDLSGALAHILPFASALHISFNDIMGAMSTMTGQGIIAADAATYLKFAVMALGNESSKGKKALHEIGMTTEQVANDLKNKGLSGTLAEITHALGVKFPHSKSQYLGALSAIVGGTRGMAATLALTGKHAGELTKNIKTIGAASTEAGGHVKGWGIANKDLSLQLERIKAAVVAVMIEIGNRLIPVISSAISFFESHATITKILAGVIGGVLLTATIAWTISLFAAGGALAFLMSPVTLIIAGVVALAAGVVYAYNHFKTFHNVVDAVGNFIKTVLVADFNLIKTIVVSVVDFVRAKWYLVQGYVINPILAIFSVVVPIWTRMVSAITTGVTSVISFVLSMRAAIVGAVSGFGSLLSSAGSALMDGLLGGIKSAFEKVKGFVSGIASTIANLKGPLDYDRKLLIPHGNAIMDGFHEGIISGFGRVQATVGGMAGSLSMPGIAINGGLGGGSAAGGGGSGTPITQNIYPQAGQSEAQIGDAAAKQLMWAMAR